jgi:small ligand-binding sensory domain FIST
MIDTIRFASAKTTEPAIDVAVDTLTAQLIDQIGDTPPDFVLTFLSTHFVDDADRFSQRIHAALRPRTLVGGTGEGIIGRDEEIERRPAISVVAGVLPNVDLTPIILRSRDFNRPLDTPAAMFDGFEQPKDPKLFVMIAEPYSAPMDVVLDAYNAAFPGVPIIGGMASAASAPGQNRLLMNDIVVSDGAVVVAFEGDIDVDIIVSQGCRPIGPALAVTGASDNVIMGLAGESPLERLQGVLAELSSEDRELLSNGLFLGRAVDPKKEVLGRGDFLIRGVMGVDRSNGAITVGDYIDEGDVVQFHLRDAETAKEDLEMMLTPHSLFGKPSGAFLFSCNGRGTRLFDHANGDISALQQFFPGLDVAGFFCAGEIGPIGNFLHGQTASLALIRSRAATKGAS